MATARQKIALNIGVHPQSSEDFVGKPAHEIYGELVFNDAAQKKYLSKDVYKKLKATALRGEPLDASIADQVAQAMKEWAMEHGASHYTHWFVPITGLSAEKHDSFLNPNGDGSAVSEFDGKTLIKGEPDASSFPSGGIRATAEARGYTAWDPTSPAFISKEANGATLTIPTAFVSYTHEALDFKTPLLRSQEALSKQAVRVLRLFGNHSAKRVFSTLGPEQEYFLIDRRYYEQRPDLIATGRTLFGASPYRGQELEDHYFAPIRERILAFMQDLDRELYRLGIPAKTRHNEVAPAQFELAPVFELSSVCADHNMLVMELLRRVALRHGLACLLHEKPFARINGNGKHNNWSMATDQGENLLEPGHTPHDNAQFLAFLTAVISAVDSYAELLRIGIAGPGNDHRLGANEAPPAIISIFLGDQLTDIVNQLEKGGASRSKSGGVMELGVSTLPPLPKDATDRNRTSPFAFTGNKFEFRAVGSTQPVYWPNTILNLIVAEALENIATSLEKNKGNFNKALASVLQKEIKEHKRVIFNGNGYAAEWHKEAAKRGLPNNTNTPDALHAMEKAEYKKLFAKHKVLNSREYDSREEIMWERYVKVVNIEASATKDIAQNQILPAAIEYMGRVACSVKSADEAGVPSKGAKATLESLNKLVNELTGAISALGAVHDKAGAEATVHKQGYAFRDHVIPAMSKVRDAADLLENIVVDELWPLPKYREMLFQY
jgi:glutamine synthetase